MSQPTQGTFHGGPTSLSRLIESSRRWEGTAVPIGTETRRVAWVALLGGASLAFLSPYLVSVDSGFLWLAEGLFRDVAAAAVAMIPMILATLAPLVVVAVLTSGFTQAGRRLQVLLMVALAAVAIAALPATLGALLIVANLVGWIIYGLVVVAAIAFLVAALLSQ